MIEETKAAGRDGVRASSMVDIPTWIAIWMR